MPLVMELLLFKDFGKNRPASSANGRIVRAIFRVGLAVCMCACAGCKSNGKARSTSFASVIVSGNTPGQIRDAAVKVFADNGYKVSQTDPGNLVFEKKGTSMNNFAYGSWLGDDPVWVRVKAAVEPVGEMTFRLQCSAFMVRDRGGSTEEEIAISRMRSRPYQKMLDAVAQQFAR